MTNKAYRLKVKTYTKEIEDEKQYVEVLFFIEPDNKVKIYRKKIEGMVFDFDEEEYFDDFSVSEADVIYEGLPEIINSYAEFCDYDVETGATYAYWVQTERSGERITGPVGVTVRDPRIWWHFDKIADRMKKLEERYKNVSCIKVGETVAHKPLIALFAGNRKNMVVAVGAIHAAESGPEILLTCAEELLENNQELLNKVGIAILPSVNADMREEVVSGLPKYYRVNKNGVDLNRNFNATWDFVNKGYGLSSDDPECETYRGPYPESEPETRAVTELIKLADPKLILSYHALASITCDDLLCAKSMKEDKETLDKLERIARVYSDGFRTATGEPCREGNILYPNSSPGSLGEWSYINGYLSLDLELRFGGSLDYFEKARKAETTVEMLEDNTELHKNAIISVLKYLS